MSNELVPHDGTQLPPSFWDHPQDALGDDPTLSLIFTQVLDRLRAEAVSNDTLEMMLIERIAFLYCHVRYRETKKMFAQDKAYKETVQLWTSLAAELQRFRKGYQDAYRIREQIMTVVQDAVVKAVETLPPEERRDFTQSLVYELDQSGL